MIRVMINCEYYDSTMLFFFLQNSINKIILHYVWEGILPWIIIIFSVYTFNYFAILTILHWSNARPASHVELFISSSTCTAYKWSHTTLSHIIFCNVPSVILIAKASNSQSNTSERDNIFQKNWWQTLFEASVVYLVSQDASWEIKFNFEWQDVSSCSQLSISLLVWCMMKCKLIERAERPLEIIFH